MSRLKVNDPRNPARELAIACLLILLLAGQVVAETGDHQAMYYDAVARVQAGESRIAAEMARIARGEVSHYDFLQYEHSELLRHARALRHPPVTLAGGQRAEVIARAEKLVEVIDSLELLIADFLRTQALLRSAISNTRDLVAGLSRSELSDAQVDSLQELDALVSAVQENNSRQVLAALNGAYTAVLEIEPDPRRKTELSIQNRLIQNNASGSELATQRLAGSGLKEQADSFQEYYFLVTEKGWEA